MDLTVKRKSWQADDQSWKAASHGTDLTRSISLDSAAFNAATHAPNGYVPSGLPLALITATNLYGPYTPGATNGLQNFKGCLEVNTILGAGPVGTALFEHGRVVKANVPIIAIDAAALTAVPTLTFE